MVEHVVVYLRHARLWFNPKNCMWHTLHSLLGPRWSPGNLVWELHIPLRFFVWLDRFFRGDQVRAKNSQVKPRKTNFTWSRLWAPCTHARLFPLQHLATFAENKKLARSQNHIRVWVTCLPLSSNNSVGRRSNTRSRDHIHQYRHSQRNPICSETTAPQQYL